MTACARLGGGIAARFTAHVARAPHVAALDEGDGAAWSWLDIAARVHQLALEIVVHTAPGDGVALLVEEGAPLVIAELAAWHSGCWCCPLDPQMPARRYEAMAGRLGIAAAVAYPLRRDLSHATIISQGWARRPSQADVETVFGADDAVKTFEGSARAATSDRCYVQHTSGSMGDPKPVSCTHAQIEAYAQRRCAVEGVGDGSRVLMASSSTFDPSQGDVATWVAAGCVLVAPSRPVLFHSFERLLAGCGVTHVLAAPSVFSVLDAAPAAFPQLEVVALGGEPTPPHILAVWGAHATPRLYNVYGVTEATVYQTYKRMAADTDPRVIGRPYPGVSVTVRCAETGTAIPPGAEGVGELCIEGACVAAGYVGDAEGALGEGYATGDRCRWVPSGDCEGWDLLLLGRRDSQIKLHGVRIEPGEVEAVVGASALVRQCCVAIQNGQLAAHVVLADEGAAHSLTDLAVLALEERCRAYLSMGMRPRAFVAHASFPLTANGKVDRGALADRTRAAGAQAGDPPIPLATPLEVMLAGIWEGVLGVGGVHALSDWHRLGGTSLQAILAVRKVRAVVVGGGGGAGWASAAGAAGKPAGRVATEASGDAALFLHADSLVANRDGEVIGGDAECYMGLCDGGTYAPCRLLEYSTLRAYATFLAANGVRTPGAPGPPPPGAVGTPGGDDAHTELVKKAARSGAVAVLKELHAVGYPLAPAKGARGAKGVTLLHLAAGEGRAEAVRFLLDVGLPPTAATGRGAMAAHFAAAAGQAAALEVLLGVTPIKARDTGKQTLLHYAVRSGQMAVVQLVLEAKCVEIDATDAQFRTPLHWATFHRHAAILDELVRHGARVEFPPIPPGIVARRTRLPAHPPADLALQVFAGTQDPVEQATAVRMLAALLARGACSGKTNAEVIAQRRAGADALAEAGYAECAERLREAVAQSAHVPTKKRPAAALQEPV